MNCFTSIISAVVAVIYFICKFFEVKFFAAKEGDAEEDDDCEDGKSKPLKEILRDTVLVYISVWIGAFILDQFQAELGGKTARAPQMVFTDPPNF